MSSFQTFKSGRLYVHILPTTQFKTRYISMKLARPIDRTTVTSIAMLPFLWMEGTEEYPTAKSLIRRTESMYGTNIRTSIGKRGDMHVAELHATFPNQEVVTGNAKLADEVLHLLTSVLTHPARENDVFVEAHVHREKNLHKHRIESLYDDKISYAMEQCLKEVCGESPAGLPRLGFEEDVNGLTCGNLYRDHQALLNESEIHTYFIGEVADAEKQANDIFSRLNQDLVNRTSTSEKTVEPLPLRHAESKTVVERQDLQQGKLNLGFRTGISYSAADYMSLLTANGILGGFPHSKLFVNVREKASLAYYATSRLEALNGVLAIQTGIDVGNYDEALKIILEQVDKLKQGDITADELDFTLRGIKNQYVQALDQPAAMADVHFSGRLAGVDRGVDDLIASIDGVQPDAVVEAANTLELDTVYFLRNQEGARHA
ncbi:EF-P 5-aminopentanol modification-associated protein YfmF [Alicyclobacillus sp. SO9]|uniref:EF-P 5-aminopentanol modification-associated protein YfmF n=1 Tax=Alicyclobacillus sp. SO9 TaxID=2665646 RepID=UPI0018E78692|nr:pitrilysin family protein [Alicyclobacillus sp. SO9]QQE80351.1 insulinase family protein [Alicyclobacillus sp. SO9]